MQPDEEEREPGARAERHQRAEAATGTGRAARRREDDRHERDADRHQRDRAEPLTAEEPDEQRQARPDHGRQRRHDPHRPDRERPQVQQQAAGAARRGQHAPADGRP